MTLALGIAALTALATVAASLRVLREYERAIVFRLGRLTPNSGPGLVALIPGIDRMVRVDLRTVTMTVSPQEIITRDNVPARVAAVCYLPSALQLRYLQTLPEIGAEQNSTIVFPLPPDLIRPFLTHAEGPSA